MVSLPSINISKVRLSVAIDVSTGDVAIIRMYIAIHITIDSNVTMAGVDSSDIAFDTQQINITINTLHIAIDNDVDILTISSLTVLGGNALGYHLIHRHLDSVNDPLVIYHLNEVTSTIDGVIHSIMVDVVNAAHKIHCAIHAHCLWLNRGVEG